MSGQGKEIAEDLRLSEDAARRANWKRWGPYLSERQWGTVREDYSPDGDSWSHFPFEHSHLRAYRWGEDGLLGITDRECRLCFALTLWNGKDPILKERLFGLAGPQGNHGEDVKELYYYLDATPTSSYLKAMYRYPHEAFPYERLRAEGWKHGRHAPEFELEDTGIFTGNRFFEVTAEYAKAGPDDVLIRVTVKNQGQEKATIHLLPTLWFRNTWIWGCRHEGCTLKPRMRVAPSGSGPGVIQTEHETLGRFTFMFDRGPDGKLPGVLVTENETNTQLLYGHPNYTRYTKDAIGRFVVEGFSDAVREIPGTGTKAALHHVAELAGGQSLTVRMRLFPEDQQPAVAFGKKFDETFSERIREADEFYARRLPAGLSAPARLVARQAYAGLLWSKQFYHYIIRDWLEGDPNYPPPPPRRKSGRNHDWPHLFNRDVISMPDKWEYPWYAAWDLAFHMIPLAHIDAAFAKEQLSLFLREWYMHPNGQLPAYEWALGDVNPPVHAWACWRVYKLTAPRGKRDRAFLASAFQKLLLNFTWWVNRKDPHGQHLFAGGFLGLDNIGVFDRSKPLPGGGHLEQADGTAWMAFYCLTMLSIALELAPHDRAYEDMASKFFEHFVAIADAINTLGGSGLWDEQDGFYYDQLRTGDGATPIRLRSLVGLMPLCAVALLDCQTVADLQGFKKRTDWFLRNRADLAGHIAYLQSGSREQSHGNFLLAIPSRQRLERVLRYLLDENEFLSPFGVRSLSRVHRDHPYVLRQDGREYGVAYAPGESTEDLFGGNSNWRGPIWFPVNYLIIEALEQYHHFYGDSLQVECPTGSGNKLNLQQVADEIARRLTRLFLPDERGRRPCHGRRDAYAQDPIWRDLLLFHEYFHGDTGQGLGASHQTGWTALVIRCLEQLAHAQDGTKRRPPVNSPAG